MTMRRILTWLINIAIIGMAIVIVRPVFAADLPAKAPVYAPPPAPAYTYTWTGFYVGLNGGAGWGQDSSTVTSVVGSSTMFNLPIASQPTSGWLAGGTLGYNWQTGPIVFGLEGDFDWTDINGSTACLGMFGCSSKQSWIGDVTGRVGVVTPSLPLLLFLKGGWAWSDFSYGFGNSFFGTTIAASASSTRSGALLGTGVEYMFMSNWSAKVEYDFIDWGSSTLAFPLTVSSCPGCTLPTFNASIRNTESLMKVGVNYKFNF
jgi:outer membrane immunogenic protein